MGDDRRAKKAAKEFDRQLAAWQAERHSYANMVDVARDYTGTTDPGLVLKNGEAIFLTITNTSLIEDRRGPGQYAGRSQGISFPIASIGGRSIRYRVGATKGHFVQGTPMPTAIDTGTTYITNQRIVFRGGKQTRECAFSKLLGFSHTDDGTTVFSVSNRQKPTVIHYGPAIAGDVAFRLELALAHYNGGVATLVGQLEEALREIDARRPTPPLPPPPSPEALAAFDATRSSSGDAPAVSNPLEPNAIGDATSQIQPSDALQTPQGWFPDPWELAELRWWDGVQWTGNISASHPQA